MKKISYTKLNGAGNDFILIDLNENRNMEITPDIVRQLSDRNNGIGADGVILIKDSDQYDFDMVYFNSDGSTGSLCGNGARCAIKYAVLSGRVEKKTVFQSNGERYSGELISENIIRFYLGEPKSFDPELKINTLNQSVNAAFVNTGAPHVVINILDVLRDVNNPGSFYNDLEKFPVYEVGKNIRYSTRFSPEGININFIQIDENIIYIRTYERGVENETLACGTGSVAAAITAYFKYNLDPPVLLKVKSGAELIVNFETAEHKVQNLSLTGPVEIEFKNEYLI